MWAFIIRLRWPSRGDGSGDGGFRQWRLCLLWRMISPPIELFCYLPNHLDWDSPTCQCAPVCMGGNDADCWLAQVNLEALEAVQVRAEHNEKRKQNVGPVTVLHDLLKA